MKQPTTKQPMKRSEQSFFTNDQRKFIQNDLKEKGLSEFQQEQFLITCERTLLDPFSRQIYARAQATKKTFPGGSEEWVKELIIITAIDGLRSVAERSGEYRGQTPIEWFGKDPESGKLEWLPFWSGVAPQFPEAARVGVYRETFKEPLIGVARYLSYVQMTKGYRAEGNKPAKSPQPTTFWLKMPDVMLAKCAEAVALRKAFPMLLSGIFLAEEVKDEAEVAEEQHEPMVTSPAEKTIIIPGSTVPVKTPAPAPAAPQKPAEAPKPAEVPALPEKTAVKRKPKPEPAPDVEEVPFGDEEETTAGDEPEWASYVISHITMTDYAGKAVRELSPAQIKQLKSGWVEKYAAKIAINPDKQHEANMISAAYAHHFPG